MNKSLAEISCEINSRIHEEMSKMEQVIAILSNFVGFLVLLVILDSIWYWWSYIHKVRESTNGGRGSCIRL